MILNSLAAETSYTASDGQLGGNAQAKLFSYERGVGSLASIEFSPNLRVGASIGKVNRLDLGIAGFEVGVNGIRVSTALGGIRLFGKE